MERRVTVRQLYAHGWDTIDSLSIRGDGSYLVGTTTSTACGIVHTVSAFNVANKGGVLAPEVLKANAYTSTGTGRPRGGFKDGSRSEVDFGRVGSIAVLRDGISFLFYDAFNSRLRECSRSGTVTTRAGNGNDRVVDGGLSKSQLSSPHTLCINGPQDVCAWAEFEDDVFRTLSKHGKVTTVMGRGKPTLNEPSFTTAWGYDSWAVSFFHSPDTSNEGCIQIIGADGTASRLTTPTDGKPWYHRNLSGVYSAVDGNLLVGREVTLSGNVTILGINDEDQDSLDAGDIAYAKALKVINPTSGSSTILTLADESGDSVYISYDTHLAIDEDGNVVYANQDGIGIISNTGIAPGRTAFRSPFLFWTATLRCHFHQSSAVARSAVKTVLLCAARSHLYNLPVLQLQPGSEQREAFNDLPPLPIELWHYILSRLRLYELGCTVYTKSILALDV